MTEQDRLTILIGNIKGGAGKTTVATHLAGAFAGAWLRTAIADCDRQRSSLRWLERRPPTVAPIQGLDWSRKTGEVPDTVERLVIDAPAAMRAGDAKDLVTLADIIIVPILPSVMDQDATALYLDKIGEIKSVRKNRRIVVLIGNRIRLGTNSATELDRFAAGRGLELSARLRDTQLYATAAQRGLTVFELGGSRAAEYQAEWAGLLRLAGCPAATPAP